MAIADIFRISKKLNKPNSLDKSLDNVHIKKLFSLVFDGNENGSLSRAFIAGKRIKPYEAQLHTHTYSLKITPIKGVVTHHVAHIKDNAIHEMSRYKYKSPLNGGSGLVYFDDVNVEVVDYVIPLGSTIHLDSKDIHTISCTKGSIWIVEELGFDTDSSTVLGNPFIIDGLYSDPRQYQVNDMHQLVQLEVNKIVVNHKLIQEQNETDDED